MKLLFTLICIFISFLSISQKAYVELGRKLNTGNVSYAVQPIATNYQTKEVIYNNHIYSTSIIEANNNSTFPSTNNTTINHNNAYYFFLMVKDTLGNEVYSSIHYIGQMSSSISNFLQMKVDNGNVYIVFNTSNPNFATTNNSIAPTSSVSHSVLVYFSAATIQNNGANYDYATILGSDFHERVWDIKIKNNDVYLVQEVASMTKYVTNGSIIQNSMDIYLIKISSSTIQNNLTIQSDPANFATLLGGNQPEQIYSGLFDVDDIGNVYLAVISNSNDIVTTNGTTPSINNNEKTVIYKISVETIDNDLPINSSPNDFCSYLPASFDERANSIALKDGDLYVIGTINGNSLPTTGGPNSTAGTPSTYLVKFSAADFASQATTPTYFQLFSNVSIPTECRWMILYNDELYSVGYYSNGNIATTDGSTLNGTKDMYLTKVSLSTIQSNGNWIDQSEFLVSLGGNGAGELVTHLEINHLGIHLIVSGSSGNAVYPTNETIAVNTYQNSEYYVNYCTNGTLQYATQYGIMGLGSHYTATLNNSVYLFNFYYSVLETLPFYQIPNPQIYEVFGFTKITFLTPENFVNDPILPASQTVCQYGLATVLDGINRGIVNDSMPDMYLFNTTMHQYSDQYNYQWQSSNSPNGPWTDIANGILEDYLPLVTNQDMYYRRVTYVDRCANQLIASISDVAAVLVNTTSAPITDAGAVLHTCIGSPVTLGGNPTVSGGTPPYTYQWDNGIASTSNPNFSPTTSTIVSLTVTDANGCKDLDQVTVMVHIANAGPDVSICSGQPTTINAVPIQGLTGVTYSWSPANGLSCTDCPNPTASTTQTETYTLEIAIPLTNGNACTTTDQVVVNTVAGPSQNNFAGPDKTICFGTTVQLGLPAENGFTYEWFPSGNLNDPFIAQPTFEPNNQPFNSFANPLNFYMVAKKNGCEFTDVMQLIQIHPVAGPDLCSSGIIGREEITPISNQTYLWQLISGTSTIIGPNNQSQATVTGSTNPSYYELLVELNGVTCRDTVKVEQCICPQDLAVAHSKIKCPTYLFPNDSIELRMNPILTGTNYTYSWSPSIGLSAYNTNPVILRTDQHLTYTLTVFDSITNYTCITHIEVNNPSWNMPHFNPLDTTICNIVNIDLGTGNTNINHYTYDWHNPLGYQSNLSNPIITPVYGSNMYLVEIVDTISKCELDTIVRVIVENFMPSVSEDWYVCENDLVQLNNTINPNVIYEWSPSSADWQNGTNHTSEQPIVKIANDVTFTVEMTNTLTGCIKNEEVKIFVNQVPQLPSLQNYSICKNESVKIGNPGVNGINYSWSPSTGLSCTDCPQPFANPATTTTYQLTISTAENCTAPFQQTTVVEVKETPLSLQDKTYCPSDGPISLAAFGANAYTEYYWSPINLVSNSSIANPTTNVQAETWFYLTVKGQNGCFANDSLKVSTIIPSVNAGVNKTICLENGSIDIGSPTNTGNLAWSPTTNLSSTTSPTTIFTPTQAGNFNFVLTNSENGCHTRDTVTINVVKFSTGILNSQLICKNNCINIGLPSIPGVVYNWSPSSELNSATIGNPTVCLNQSTDFTMIAKGLNGCIDQQTISVIVSDIESPQIELDDMIICAEDLTNQVSLDVMPNGNYSYQWTPSTGLSATNIPEPNVYPLNYGLTNYTILVTDQATGCQSHENLAVLVKDCTLEPCAIPFNATITEDTICNLDQVFISFNSDSTNVTYHWTTVSTNVTGATNNIGNSISEVLTNTSNVIGTVVYKITPVQYGCSGIAKDIVIKVAPTPTSSIVGYFTICDGTSTNLASQESASTYSWSNGQTDSVASFTLNDNPISLTTTNAYGCSNTSNAITLTEATSSSSNQTISICSGQSFTINNHSYNTSGVYHDTLVAATGCDSIVTTYLTVHQVYTINNPQSICEGTTYSINGHNYTLSGTFVDTLVSMYGCDSIVTTVLTVNPNPIPQFIGNGEYCIGDSYQLSLTENYTYYQWSTGATTNSITATTVNNPITVTVTNTAGCSATSSSFVLQEVSAITFHHTQEICEGESALIHGISQNTAGVYSQSFPSSFNCDSLAVVTLSVLPAPNISAGNHVTICPGETVTLSASGANSYTWSHGIQNNIPFSPTQSTVYTVSGTGINGCIGTAQVEVTIENLQTIDFTISDTTGCAPLAVTFTPTSITNLGSCVWNFGNSMTTNNCNSVTTTYTQAGCYDVTLTSTSINGCVGTKSKNNAICIQPSPIAAFSASSTTISKSDATIDFSNTSINATSYTWNFGDNYGHSTTKNPTYSYSEEFLDAYTVVLIAENQYQCKDTASMIIRLEENVIYYVPNSFTPDGDQHNNVFKPVFSEGIDPNEYKLSIYNRWGELIFVSHNVEEGWNGTYGNIRHIVQDGTYLWKIEFKPIVKPVKTKIVGHVNLIK